MLHCRGKCLGRGGGGGGRGAGSFPASNVHCAALQAQAKREAIRQTWVQRARSGHLADRMQVRFILAQVRRQRETKAACLLC